MPGLEPKKLKNELHHWWPKVVSRHWADANGNAHQISNDGKEVSSNPVNFGAIRNDNNIKLGRVPTVWDESFEKAFARADDQFNTVITWLRDNSHADGPAPGALLARVRAIDMPDEIHAMLAECLASLIVRSPRFRFCVRLTTDHYRGRFGFPDPADQALIGLNVRHCQDMFQKALRRPGKFAIISASKGEFIFGDGFLSNFTSAAAAPSTPSCLVPVTPEVSVFYTSPMQYRTHPKAHSLTLAPDEVLHFNNIVQVYSKRFIFYRSQRPKLTDEFLKGEHLQRRYDKDAFLEELSLAMGETISPFGGFPAGRFGGPKK